MNLQQVYGSGKFGLSFELFPPKTPAGDEEMFGHVSRLVEFSPDYITCTYGAGGSMCDKTLQIVDRVRQQFGCLVASHLTCVGSTVDDLRGHRRMRLHARLVASSPCEAIRRRARHRLSRSPAASLTPTNS